MWLTFGELNLLSLFPHCKTREMWISQEWCIGEFTNFKCLEHLSSQKITSDLLRKIRLPYGPITLCMH